MARRQRFLFLRGASGVPKHDPSLGAVGKATRSGQICRHHSSGHVWISFGRFRFEILMPITREMELPQVLRAHFASDIGDPFLGIPIVAWYKASTHYWQSGTIGPHLSLLGGVVYTQPLCPRALTIPRIFKLW